MSYLLQRAVHKNSETQLIKENSRLDLLGRNYKWKWSSWGLAVIKIYDIKNWKSKDPTIEERNCHDSLKNLKIKNEHIISEEKKGIILDRYTVRKTKVKGQLLLVRSIRHCGKRLFQWGGGKRCRLFNSGKRANMRWQRNFIYSVYLLPQSSTTDPDILYVDFNKKTGLHTRIRNSTHIQIDLEPEEIHPRALNILGNLWRAIKFLKNWRTINTECICWHMEVQLNSPHFMFGCEASKWDYLRYKVILIF